ncbi:MAG: NAD-dependent epimerase/dehydratase family protein [Myxococcales bacterium]|nr:NAD-dependent epimerase/dehydratase family protein [Myxococcales bacterium]
MAEERAAVSGATGFIGSAVVRELLAAGRPVRALVEPGAPRTSLEGLDVEVVEVDVTNLEGMTAALADCGAYYHLAAIYKVWTPDPDAIYRVNLEGTTVSLLAARAAGVARVVYTSSIAAVGFREDGKPANESVPFNAYDIANDYVLTKHLSERIAARFAEAGHPIVIVNPAFPFGERDIAPTPTGGIILALLRGEVPAMSPGGFCAVDVHDVAKAHVAAESRGRVGERYILGNHNVTFAEFAQLVCEIADRTPPRITLPAVVGRVAARAYEQVARITHQAPPVTLKSAQYMQRRAWFDTAKARDELGMPCTPLAQSVQRAIAYFRATGMV